VKNQKTSLFLGRFQPFHRGHLDAIFSIFEKFPDDFLIIAIGSARDDFSDKNPFTAAERAAMIFAALDDAGISRQKYNLCPIPDIHHFSLYPAFCARFLPPFSRVFSGSEITRELFSRFSDAEVFEICKRQKISATAVREKLKNGDDFSKMVPAAVFHFLEKIAAKKRFSAF